MIDNKKSTDLGKLAREYNRRCELEASVWLVERLQAENENLKAQLANRDLNIRNLTSLLDSIPPHHTDEELENLAYLRDNFIDQRMDYYMSFGQCEEEARESSEEDALEHFPAPEVSQ